MLQTLTGQPWLRRSGGDRHAGPVTSKGANAAVVVLLMCLSGCTSAEGHRNDPAGDSPAAASVPAEDPPCPLTGAQVPIDGRLPAARDKILRDVAAEHPDIFTDDYSCGPTNTLYIYRVPGHDAFDHDLKSAAKKYAIRLLLVDQKYSADDIRRAAAGVAATGPQFKGHRIAVESTYWVRDSGGAHPVTIDRNSDPAQARSLLSDLGPIIKIVKDSRVFREPGSIPVAP